ncbi:unnamed protein product [Schistosoma margrebowiei]|uniref:Sulfotransferase domain-containing protein n=1 Tax=Schistosoma margrebowiei TaxID=48269 RepID=A0AA84Z8V1_9TREM|nr:unnamed protein product [Schistosoma margrebowiei]
MNLRGVSRLFKVHALVVIERILLNRRLFVLFSLFSSLSLLIFIFYANKWFLNYHYTNCFMSAKQFSKTDNYSFINNNNAHGTNSNIKPYPVVVYNRIPKTGSTSLINLVYQLIEENYSHTHVIHLNISSNKHYLNRVNELYLIDNLTHWTSMHPLIIHGHFAYINFIKYGSLFNPIYINMIRNPLDRLVSYYYFLRYGDDFRPYLIRKRMFDIVTRNQTFDECVLANGSDCSPQLLWVQVPFFCGQAAYCRIPGNPVAVETAKRRVIENYLIVGLTEEFDKFVNLLEILLPSFFTGAHNLISRSKDKWHLRRTNYKLPISKATTKIYQDNPIWQAEQEFYNFVRTEFHTILSALQGQSSHQPLSKFSALYKKKINFDKIRPKFGA